MNTARLCSSDAHPQRPRGASLSWPTFAALLSLALLAFATDARAQTPPTNQNESAQQAPVGEVIDDDDVLRVDSNLVSIPAIVMETTGRAVTNLRLEDFELRVDGQPKPLSELHLADAPLVLAVLFDNSSSLSQARAFEKQAAVRFFQRIVRPIDHASIYSVSTVPVLARPLTNNVGVLVRSIEQFPEPEGATALFDAIAEASTYLRRYDTRKVIVIVSDGNDTISEATFDQALQRALKAGCQIYVVGTGDIENQSLTDTIAKRRLQVLAAQTGGALYVPRTVEELDFVFDQIYKDISQQYVLSYAPTDDPADGRFRAIELKIKARPTLRVRAREGYYATTGGGKAPGQQATLTATQIANAPRVRPRRANATNANGRKGAGQKTEEQVASLDPLYAPASTLAGNGAVSSSEINIRTKPVTASRGVVQPGPHEYAEVAAAGRPAPPANDIRREPSPVATAPAPSTTPVEIASPPQSMKPTGTLESVPAEPEPTPTPVKNAEPATVQNPEPTPVTNAGRPSMITGGVLNGKALNLPKPIYTTAARSAGAKGSVTVEVEIDEEGRVVKAKATAGHVLLQNPAINAARQARFSPTLLSGLPIKVKGIIVYNFL